MFEDLIKETEKENNKHGLGKCDCKTEFICITKMHECVRIIKTLKQCQTIAEENIKKAKELLDDCMSGGCDREMVLKQFDDIFKQQLNPAQTKE